MCMHRAASPLPSTDSPTGCRQSPWAEGRASSSGRPSPAPTSLLLTATFLLVALAVFSSGPTLLEGLQWQGKADHLAHWFTG